MANDSQNPLNTFGDVSQIYHQTDPTNVAIPGISSASLDIGVFNDLANAIKSVGQMGEKLAMETYKKMQNKENLTPFEMMQRHNESVAARKGVLSVNVPNTDAQGNPLTPDQAKTIALQQIFAQGGSLEQYQIALDKIYEKNKYQTRVDKEALDRQKKADMFEAGKMAQDMINKQLASRIEPQFNKLLADASQSIANNNNITPENIEALKLKTKDALKDLPIEYTQNLSLNIDPFFDGAYAGKLQNIGTIAALKKVDELIQKHGDNQDFKKGMAQTYEVQIDVNQRAAKIDSQHNHQEMNQFMHNFVHNAHKRTTEEIFNAWMAGYTKAKETKNVEIENQWVSMGLKFRIIDIIGGKPQMRKQGKEANKYAVMAYNQGMIAANHALEEDRKSGKITIEEYAAAIPLIKLANEQVRSNAYGIQTGVNSMLFRLLAESAGTNPNIMDEALSTHMRDQIEGSKILKGLEGDKRLHALLIKAIPLLPSLIYNPAIQSQEDFQKKTLEIINKFSQDQLGKPLKIGNLKSLPRTVTDIVNAQIPSPEKPADNINATYNTERSIVPGSSSLLKDHRFNTLYKKVDDRKGKIF